MTNLYQIRDNEGKEVGSVEAWFPKPIFQTDSLLDEKSLCDLKKILEKYFETNTARTRMLYVDSTHRTDNFAYNPNFKIITSAIKKKAEAFAKFLGYSEEQVKYLEFTNMWANRSNRGDFNFPHVHAGSLFSGVFYVEAPDDSFITFYNNIYNVMLEPDSFNEFTYDYTRYDCKKNRLILFRSDMLHGNEYQDSDGKIAVSFNLRINQPPK